MNYYVVRGMATREALGVVKAHDKDIQMFFACIERITQSEYETYLEFGMENMTVHKAVIASIRGIRIKLV